ncbi:MAG: DUF2267 domain-containing protein [Actinomycetota bacterium]|nr:DUF2267 domain-containing protein [Actinomycetota bacterium]
MKHDEFVARVRELAELQTNEEAERAIRAAFETLKERLAGNEPNNLADQLPPEIAEPLRGEGGRDNFSLAEFYRQVAETEGVEEPEAIRHARAVAAVLQAAVTTGEMDHIREQLKPEYAELFGEPGE